MSTSISRTFSVAPMMDWTDRHCRYFLRQISRHALLYTEMIHSGAILNGDRDHLLCFDDVEQPVAIQIGGNNPQELAVCAKISEEYGYREINLNVGCPSGRVQKGQFGACLMASPALVAECLAEMKAAVSIPVTIKTRIGIDDRDSYEDLCAFVETVMPSGCSTFIVHARKAVLGGLSPKQNREIPPLRYETVYRLKRDFPALEIILNGGVTDLASASEHLVHVDGVMMGREAYHNPYLLAGVDEMFFDVAGNRKTRAQVFHLMEPYVRRRLDEGVPLRAIARHMLGLFHGQANAKAWRRHLSQYMQDNSAEIGVLLDAAKYVIDVTEQRNAA